MINVIDDQMIGDYCYCTGDLPRPSLLRAVGALGATGAREPWPLPFVSPGLPNVCNGETELHVRYMLRDIFMT